MYYFKTEIVAFISICLYCNRQLWKDDQGSYYGTHCEHRMVSHALLHMYVQGSHFFKPKKSWLFPSFVQVKMAILQVFVLAILALKGRHQEQF